MFIWHTTYTHMKTHTHTHIQTHTVTSNIELTCSVAWNQLWSLNIQRQVIFFTWTLKKLKTQHAVSELFVHFILESAVFFIPCSYPQQQLEAVYIWPHRVEPNRAGLRLHHQF